MFSLPFGIAKFFPFKITFVPLLLPMVKRKTSFPKKLFSSPAGRIKSSSRKSSMVTLNHESIFALMVSFKGFSKSPIPSSSIEDKLISCCWTSAPSLTVFCSLTKSIDSLIAGLVSKLFLICWEVSFSRTLSGNDKKWLVFVHLIYVCWKIKI